MGHGHGHGHTAGNTGSSGLKHRTPLLIAFGLTAAFMLVELVAGIALGSLALMSDAAHMARTSWG